MILDLTVPTDHGLTEDAAAAVREVNRQADAVRERIRWWVPSRLPRGSRR